MAETERKFADDFYILPTDFENIEKTPRYKNFSSKQKQLKDFLVLVTND